MLYSFKSILQTRTLWIMPGILLLGAVAWASTDVVSFDDGALGGPWVSSTTFGGPDDTVIIADGVCIFRKKGPSPEFSPSLAMANKQIDHRIAPPWSVEYAMPRLAELLPGGGYLCNRFGTKDALLCDGIYIKNVKDTITIGAVDSPRIFFSFPAKTASLLKVRFDVTQDGLILYATTDIGSYGQGATVKWQQDIGPNTAIGIDIMSADSNSTPPNYPFDIAIDNLCFTPGNLPDRAQMDSEANIPRFNPRSDTIGSKNLIQNSSFECGAESWSSLGKSTGWGGDVSGFYGTVVRQEAWDGQYCVKINWGPDEAPVTCFDVWPPAYDRQYAPLAANIGWIRVTRDTPITLSAYLKSNIAGTKARFLFRFAKNALDPIQQAVQEVTLSQEWARYTVTQNALDEDVCVAVGPDMTDMPDITASFWIDAIQLELGPQATPFETREPVELGITTDRYGNVYEQSQPVLLNIHGDNRSAKEAMVSLKLEMEDYFGTSLLPVVFSVNIPAGQTITVPWAISMPGKGYYRANITWSANGRSHTRRFPFTVVEPYLQDDSIFGLNHPATTAAQLSLLSKGGLRWVRNWSVNWEWVEPIQGQVSWVQQDHQMEYLKQSRMKTMAVFPNPSTNWASSAPASVEQTLWYKLAYAPVEPPRLFNFIGAAVARYQNACAHWEFLNEPLWVPNFCLPQSAGYDVADYIQLLKGAYAAIKAANPEAKVIAGLATEPKFPLGDKFIAEGGLAYCDIFNLHPYGGLMLPENFIKDMDRIQKAMRDSGEHKPIWATETAYYATDETPWSPWVAPPGHFSAGLLLPNERTAADYIVRHAIILIAHCVEKIFYHEPIEGPINNGTMDIENTFLSPDAVPKKSYAAIAALANLLGPSPRYAGALKSPEGRSVYGYAFQCNDRAVLAAWSPDQNGVRNACRLAIPQGIEVLNIMGNKVNPERIVLSESPVYLQSGKWTAEAIIAACTIENELP